MRRGQAEHQEQCALMKWAQVQAGSMPELRLLFAIPNGGNRSARVGAAMKREGVKAGVPDLMLPVARGDFHGLFIELKQPGLRPARDGMGRVSKTQQEWLIDLAEQGYLAIVCWGWEEAIRSIKEYLALNAGAESIRPENVMPSMRAWAESRGLIG